MLGIQIILWFASGLFMTLPPIQQVRGEHLIVRDDPVAEPGALARALDAYGPAPSRAELRRIGAQSVVVVDGPQGEKVFGGSGDLLEAPGEDEIASIATAHYAGSGRLAGVGLLTDAPLDYRGEMPVWQARFADPDGTRFYLDATTGEVLKVRTRLWRVFDTMWMLHIMDYDERSDFNTWWLRLAAGAALIFSLTGMVLVVHRTAARVRRRRMVGRR